MLHVPNIANTPRHIVTASCSLSDNWAGGNGCTGVSSTEISLQVHLNEHLAV